MREIERARLRARAILAAATSLIVAGACKKDGPPQAPPPPDVAVVQVEPHRLPTSFDITGEVYPYRRVEVRAREDGVIEERPFTEGATVKPGQVLYRLDRVRPRSGVSERAGALSERQAHSRPARAAGAAERRGAAGRGQRTCQFRVRRRATSPKRRRIWTTSSCAPKSAVAWAAPTWKSEAV